MFSELIKPFLLGGTIIAGSKLLSKFTTPAVASLIGGLPTGILASLFLQNSKKENYFEGYQYHSFVLFLSIVAIHYMLKHTEFNKTYICLGGFFVWAIISYITLSFAGLT